ncbi:hypothetical protein BJ878DRAFT_424050 [Calycina marina]|uniref:Nucleoporin NUP37 n=1 Tax=Calycina marina TaxID=1763456 RepID=A0A9P8CDP3_9HELO|nr:hypothetical protein BJ878DRAFT_424050 [Calycina marina]
MVVDLPKPRLSRNSQNLQLSYELPHRIHVAKRYPLSSKNGSDIIIYGHDTGVRIVWRGGRPFKSPQRSTETKKRPNGAESKVISLDDDDEDMMEAPAFVDKPEFEADEEEYDPSQPYPRITQTLDLYFGAQILDIAVLPSSILKSEESPWKAFAQVRKSIVFAAACADNLVRLVTLPLTPPSPESKARNEFRSDFTLAHAGRGSWGEVVVNLLGHHKTPGGVSITAELADDGSTTESVSVIVASHSKEVKGSMLLHRVVIASSQSAIEPFQRILLAASAKAIAFNPSTSNQRCSHLLVADSSGACRIYDYKLLVTPLSTEDEPNAFVAEQGTWLLSLYPGFQNSKNQSMQHKNSYASYDRKLILDAQWVAEGKSIIALLGDGKWGVWDVEGAGPTASSSFLGGSGVTGGSLSTFAVSGNIDLGAKLRAVTSDQPSTSKFAPMTPATRKSTDMFSAKPSNLPVRGQISVYETSSSSVNNTSDDSIVFWIGDAFITVPSLSKYWNANAQKSRTGDSMFNGAKGGRMVLLENIDLQGERCSGIEQMPKSRPSSGLPTELIVLGEHRFTIISAGKPAPAFASSIASTRLAFAEKSYANDISMRELNVDDIDRALSRMGHGHTTKRKLIE